MVSIFRTVLATMFSISMLVSNCEIRLPCRTGEPFPYNGAYIGGGTEGDKEDAGCESCSWRISFLFGLPGVEVFSRRVGSYQLAARYATFQAREQWLNAAANWR
ncbi:hypothetical protein DPEC_G00180910 [Dallia pectoralis]|uniref:Uncharacterized protein n=1 Tax=Dallia pectoralis TaxID=75939 RepID=A0ACC2GA37_DALPE|nr:hypothetical protein DPEC_G00180910 [Dallia pectoralis]